MKNKENKRSNKSAAETAYAYLASLMRTVAEMEKHLAEKGYDRDEIRETIDELKANRYLDDQQYALRYFEYNHEKRRGTLRAVRELEEKGLDSETIRNAREDFMYENSIDEFSDAIEEAEKLLSISGHRGPADEKLAASIARKLERKGFARDTIFKVLGRIRNGEPEI